MAKGKRVCDQCGNKFATPRKLCDHLKRKFKYKPKPIQIPVQPSTTQNKDQDPKAGPAPVTQDQCLKFNYLFNCALQLIK